MLKYSRMDNNCLLPLCISGTYLYCFFVSFIAMQSKLRFIRNCMHIPFGYVGGFISEFDINYGFIYFTLIIIYQILEEIENLHKYDKDFSWYDIEGYAIGFSGFIFYLYIKKSKYIKLTNTESNV